MIHKVSLPRNSPGISWKLCFAKKTRKHVKDLRNTTVTHKFQKMGFDMEKHQAKKCQGQTPEECFPLDLHRSANNTYMFPWIFHRPPRRENPSHHPTPNLQTGLSKRTGTSSTSWANPMISQDVSPKLMDSADSVWFWSLLRRYKSLFGKSPVWKCWKNIFQHIRATARPACKVRARRLCAIP